MVERTEFLTTGPAEGIAGLLDLPLPEVETGAGLPLLWHWVYLLPRPAQADLDPAGHALMAGVPAEPDRRRMWAGGRVRTSGALLCGRPATRRTLVAAVREKTGRSGRLTFVTISHQIIQDERLVIDEEQDLVYRDAAPTAVPEAAPVPPVPDQPLPRQEHEWEIETSSSLLFRFSALTYNGHRIHYDRDYTRDVEGYPGLLVHGPLQALAMAEAARRERDPGPGPGVIGLTFDYRLVSPLFDHQGLIVSAVKDDDGFSTAVRDRTGRRTAAGTLRPNR